MFHGQMSPWQFKSIQDGLRNLPLKFGQNLISNSQDITDIDFVWVGWWVGNPYFSIAQEAEIWFAF